jgi:hypothetical protein
LSIFEHRVYECCPTNPFVQLPQNLEAHSEHFFEPTAFELQERAI